MKKINAVKIRKQFVYYAYRRDYIFCIKIDSLICFWYNKVIYKIIIVRIIQKIVKKKIYVYILNISLKIIKNLLKFKNYCNKVLNTIDSFKSLYIKIKMI